MTRELMEKIMSQVFEECQKLRMAGQAEYAHKDSNAFRNFEACATFLDVDREKVLMTYLFKHFDGIAAYIKGLKSQREDVRGRINDAIVYLCLLRGMIEENNQPSQDKAVTDANVLGIQRRGL